MKLKQYVLGHSAILQRTVKLKRPLHLTPPYLGDGLSHFRVRVRVPIPHDFVQ